MRRVVQFLVNCFCRLKIALQSPDRRLLPPRFERFFLAMHAFLGALERCLGLCGRAAAFARKQIIVL
jgi:hypothetical protein